MLIRKIIKLLNIISTIPALGISQVIQPISIVEYNTNLGNHAKLEISIDSSEIKMGQNVVVTAKFTPPSGKEY